MSNLAKKEILRNYYKAVRASLSEKRRAEASQKALEKLSVGTAPLLSFWSFQTELDLTPLNLELIKQKRLLLPRVEGSHLQFYWVEETSHLIPSSFGILEPDPNLSKQANIKEFEQVLVPGLAFDQNKRRLGYGKGYYDLFLSSNPHLFSCGIGFQEQLHRVPLPQERHDNSLAEILLF